MSAPVHYAMTLEEHRAAIGGGYVDPARYNGSDRNARPEMICRTGDFHAQGVRDWGRVTCPACLERAPPPASAIVRRNRAVFGLPTRDNGYGVPIGGVPHAPGELLTMGDGSQWFHAYGGRSPVLITDANRSGLSIDA